MRLAVVANEFFDPALGPMGGFGWATRQVAEAFEERPELGVEIVMLSGRPLPRDAKVHGRVPAVGRPRRRIAEFGDVRRVAPDLILTIDYRPSYRRSLALFPRTPLIVWVRDPRTPFDCARIDTLRLPGQPDVKPQGIGTIHCGSLSGLVRFRSLAGGGTVFASPTHYLREKALGTYGVEPKAWNFLPNPVRPPTNTVPKALRPSVVFLGRLDPIKRPWLFVELARQFPEVRFIMLGRNHFEGLGAWSPASMPDNVELLGHLDGAEKFRLVREAWALVNTSIHEALATSFLEALGCETPLIACVDPDNVVSRFGYYVGRWDGDGLDSLPYFSEALRRLLDDENGRTTRGTTGRAWVDNTHTPQAFVGRFLQIAASLGVGAGNAPSGRPLENAATSSS